MQNLYLAQIPYQFETTKTIFFPYSVGLLWSYAQTIPEIKDNFNLKKFFFIRESVDDILETIVDPDVVGFSCYVWNMNFSMTLAKKIKERWPNCLIVAGGPQIPVTDNEIFEKHPFLDLVVYHEGEKVFSDVLLARLKNRNFEMVSGIAYNKNGKMHRTMAPTRIADVNEIPSPYLTGIFDDAIKEAEEKGFILNALTETNRGCPYQCTFCDWGNGVLGKVKRFDMRRVKKELLWVAKNKIEFINNCDANFGIFKDKDFEIATFLAKLKKRYGFPQVFDTSWLKNGNNYAIDTATVLVNNGLLRRFTASLQTTNVDTLKAIKRVNLEDEQLDKIIELGRKNNIVITADLIMGLPMETFDSFRRGFAEVIARNINPSTTFLSILPGSEMAEPAYREKYGIKSIKANNRLTHVQEVDEVVIETSTMPLVDMQKLILWIWFVQQFHFHGYTNVLYDFFNKRYSYSIEQFYDVLMDDAMTKEGTWPHKIIYPFRNHIVDGLTAKLEVGINNADLHTNIGYLFRKEFYNDLYEVTASILPDEDKHLLVDLMTLQDYNQYSPNRAVISEFSLNTNLYEYIYENQPLVTTTNRYSSRQLDNISKDNNFGYYIITTRYQHGWKTKIKNIN
jgi:putative methyltransferase